jgi:colanic acid/amylovoran biosynthesis protein
MPSDVDAHVIEADLRPEEIKAIIARCAAFVGTRMHANIAALSSHVPTVAISYSHKTPGIMRACGVERLALPVERLTEAQLSELLAEVYSRRNELSANLERAVAEQRRLAAMNFDILLDLLNERGLQ